MNYFDSIQWLYHTLEYVRHIDLIYQVIILKLINIINLFIGNAIIYLDPIQWLYYTLK